MSEFIKNDEKSLRGRQPEADLSDETLEGAAGGKKIVDTDKDEIEEILSTFE